MGSRDLKWDSYNRKRRLIKPPEGSYVTSASVRDRKRGTDKERAKAAIIAELRAAVARRVENGET